MEPYKFMEVIIKELVDHPEMVRVECSPFLAQQNMQIYTHPEDCRKITGVTFQALKGLCRAISGKYGVSYFLESKINIATTPNVSTVTASSGASVQDILREYHGMHGVAVEDMTRLDVLTLKGFSGVEWDEVRAYLLAQYGESMQKGAREALR